MPDLNKIAAKIDCRNALHYITRYDIRAYVRFFSHNI
ncbi:hypothetical protein fHeYen902_148 [Yersinia phage fHe-Yen9-02]|nr:hypothetical protein fHeYen902_148 [Yersinia phage fHe-Yen9-02]